MTALGTEMNMEPYTVCEKCGEKNSNNFSYCRKCGAELHLVKKINQSAQETVFQSSKKEKTDIDSMEARALSYSASSASHEELKLTVTTEKPNATYGIDRKVMSTMNTLEVMLVIPLIIKIKNRKYVINEMKERELMNVTGGLRFLSIFLLLLWIILIFLGTLTITGNLGSTDLLTQAIIIWTIGISIPFIIIGLLFDVSIYTVQNPDGSPMGEIKSNLTGSTWKILGSSNEILALIKLPLTGLNPFESLKIRTGEIKTPLGSFKAEARVRSEYTSQYKGYYLAIKCNVTDSNGNPCFTVTRVESNSHPKYGGEYRIDSQGIMSPFLTITVAVCLIDKLLSSIKSFDHESNGGCGCD
ncbi:MAG: zinc ribbon domain-containing protein [Candidatus Hodarchaeales archaeon]|jgi:ribosomal protein L40E